MLSSFTLKMLKTVLMVPKAESEWKTLYLWSTTRQALSRANNCYNSLIFSFIAAYRLRWVLEKAIKRSPTFTVDFRQLRWDSEPPVNGEEGGRGGAESTGLRQHVNSRTNTFYRKSILVDLSKRENTEKLIAAIGSIMPQRADLHFLIIGGVGD